MSASPLNDQARELLRHIVERQAYRLTMASNIRGHGLQFLPDLNEKLDFARELAFHLDVLAQVEEVYADLGGRDLPDAVRSRMELIPYPETRMELACCLAITGRAERAAARSFVECVHAGFARIAQTQLEAERAEAAKEEALFVAYCEREGHRRTAQRYWDRWLTLFLVSFGRPDTPGDQRAVELGLRNLPAGEVVHAFLDDVEPLRQACSLQLPTLSGVELPEIVRSRFPNS